MMMRVSEELLQDAENDTWLYRHLRSLCEAEQAWHDRKALGVDGVRMAARALWPGLVDLMAPEGRVRLDIYGYEPPRFKEWKEPGLILTSGYWEAGLKARFFPRPLMTTAGYAMNWYPEHNLVVYVNDWEGR